MYGLNRDDINLLLEILLRAGGLRAGGGADPDFAIAAHLMNRVAQNAPLDKTAARNRLLRSLMSLTNQQTRRLLDAICDHRDVARTPTAWLLNSAVLGAYGQYSYESASIDDLKRFIAECDPVSRIGYQDTCDTVERWTGYRPPLSRAASAMQPGEQAMVVRLRYRIPDPADKGNFQPQDDDWEIGRLVRLS